MWEADSEGCSRAPGIWIKNPRSFSSKVSSPFFQEASSPTQATCVERFLLLRHQRFAQMNAQILLPVVLQWHSSERLSDLFVCPSSPPPHHPFPAVGILFLFFGVFSGSGKKQKKPKKHPVCFRQRSITVCSYSVSLSFSISGSKLVLWRFEHTPALSFLQCHCVLIPVESYAPMQWRIGKQKKRTAWKCLIVPGDGGWCCEVLLALPEEEWSNDVIWSWLLSQLIKLTSELFLKKKKQMKRRIIFVRKDLDENGKPVCTACVCFSFSSPQSRKSFWRMFSQKTATEPLPYRLRHQSGFHTCYFEMRNVDYAPLMIFMAKAKPSDTITGRRSPSGISSWMICILLLMWLPGTHRGRGPGIGKQLSQVFGFGMSCRVGIRLILYTCASKKCRDSTLCHWSTCKLKKRRSCEDLNFLSSEEESQSLAVRFSVCRRNEFSFVFEVISSCLFLLKTRNLWFCQENIRFRFFLFLACKTTIFCWAMRAFHPPSVLLFVRVEHCHLLIWCSFPAMFGSVCSFSFLSSFFTGVLLSFPFSVHSFTFNSSWKKKKHLKKRTKEPPKKKRRQRTCSPFYSLWWRNHDSAVLMPAWHTHKTALQFRSARSHAIFVRDSVGSFQMFLSFFVSVIPILSLLFCCLFWMPAPADKHPLALVCGKILFFGHISTAPLHLNSLAVFAISVGSFSETWWHTKCLLWERHKSGFAQDVFYGLAF